MFRKWIRRISGGDRPDLCTAFQEDIRRAWEEFCSKRRDWKPYALVMYGVDVGDPYLWPAILTEEELTAVGQRYVDKGLMDTLEEARLELRFSVADAPDAFLFDDRMPAVKASLASLEATAGDEGAEWKQLTEAAVEALSQLDNNGLFGSGTVREELLLLVIVEDSLDGCCEDSARRLNSRAAYKRFQDHTRLDGVFKSCGALASTPDGRYLFAACTVPDPNAPNEENTVNEIAAYSLEGAALRRQWEYRFPSFGDSVRDMAVAADVGMLWTVRLRYEGSTGSAMIQQFALEGSHPLQQQHVPEEPAAMAVAHDGSLLALLVRKAVLLFDTSLDMLHRVELEARCYDVWFLRNHDLLVATDDGVRRVAADGQLHPTTIEGKAFSLSMDASESKLAVGRWFDIGVIDEKKRIELPVRLYEFPSLRELREIHYPGHQLVLPTLCPDGGLLSCMANRVHGSRKSVVVFDVESGELVGESKSDFVHALAFLPDNRTIVIPKSGFMDAEPIRLWARDNHGENEQGASPDA